MSKFAGCILLLALATPSYAMSLRNAKAVAAEVDVEARMDRLLTSRKVRSLPYSGGPPADAANLAADPGAGGGAMGPVDAFLDAPLDPKGGGGDSSEDIDTLIAELEAKIAELSALPPADVLAVEERVAQLQEQIAAKEAPAPQEQAQQEQQQQAEAAAPSPPEPAATGPDNSNKEDGDGNGNSGPDSGGGGQQEAGGQQQQDSGAGAPDPPAAPEAPAPYEPPQGNALDQGNEDTKS